jgi:diguanylate cyclase
VLVETDHDGALTIAERIRQQIASKPADVSNVGPVPFTMSIGVSTFEGHPDYQYLIDAADRALYRAKEGGRNRVVSEA